jgi:hypothetical protein
MVAVLARNNEHWLLRIPAMPIANSKLMAITIPKDADRRRSEATLGCSYHAERNEGAVVDAGAVEHADCTRLLLKEAFQLFWFYRQPKRASDHLEKWMRSAMRSRLEPFKKFVRMLRPRVDPRHGDPKTVLLLLSSSMGTAEFYKKLTRSDGEGDLVRPSLRRARRI